MTSLPDSGYRPLAPGVWVKTDRECGVVAGRWSCRLAEGHAGEHVREDGLPLFMFPEHAPDHPSRDT